MRDGLTKRSRCCEGRVVRDLDVAQERARGAELRPANSIAFFPANTRDLVDVASFGVVDPDPDVAVTLGVRPSDHSETLGLPTVKLAGRLE